MRMEAQTPRFEAGHVLLPKEAPWLATFLDELLAFPRGRHDDQVDSVSQFLKWAWADSWRSTVSLSTADICIQAKASSQATLLKIVGSIADDLD